MYMPKKISCTKTQGLTVGAQGRVGFSLREILKSKGSLVCKPLLGFSCKVHRKYGDMSLNLDGM